MFEIEPIIPNCCKVKKKGCNMTWVMRSNEKENLYSIIRNTFNIARSSRICVFQPSNKKYYV